MNKINIIECTTSVCTFTWTIETAEQSKMENKCLWWRRDGNRCVQWLCAVCVWVRVHARGLIFQINLSINYSFPVTSHTMTFECDKLHLWLRTQLHPPIATVDLRRQCADIALVCRMALISFFPFRFVSFISISVISNVVRWSIVIIYFIISRWLRFVWFRNSFLAIAVSLCSISICILRFVERRRRDLTHCIAQKRTLFEGSEMISFSVILKSRLFHLQHWFGQCSGYDIIIFYSRND